MYCKDCGTGLSGEEFCPNCGTTIVKQNRIMGTNISESKKDKNRKKFLQKGIIVIVFLLFLIGVGFFLLNVLKKNKETKKYSGVSEKMEITYHYDENEIPKFISGKFSSQKVSSSTEALKALEDIKEDLKINDIEKELKLEREEKSENVVYYRFKQMYNDIPVFNQNIIISVDSHQNVLGFSGYYIPNIKLETNPKITKEKIEEIAKQNLGEGAKIHSSELAIWVREGPTLVYVVNGISSTKAVEMMIDANSGEVISEVDALLSSSTYSYTGKGIDNKEYTINLEEYYEITALKNRYHFYDPERKIEIYNYQNLGPIFSSISSMTVPLEPIIVDINNGKIDYPKLSDDFIKDAITAMAHFEIIYDYYKDVLGRNSYDNKGGKIKVNIGLTASTLKSDALNNAFWFGPSNQMYIGSWEQESLDGSSSKSFSASLDVLAHEFTHGVVQYTAGFASSPKDTNKAFEAGALNEAYADIMGSLIEGKNWTIAESNQILRSALEPEKFKTASKRGGKYYYPDGYLEQGQTLDTFLQEHNLEKVTDYDKGGVHDNATVVTHAAYLMYNDGAFKDREEMAKVWYNSLFLLSSYSTFEDCAYAVLQTAKNFGLSDEAIHKMTNAFIEVNILQDTSYSLTGKVMSGKIALKDAKIEVYSYKDNQLVDTVSTDKEGKYELSLKSGTYKIKVTRKEFNAMEENVTILGNTNLDFSLAHTQNNNACGSVDCVNVTMYFLETAGNDLEEKSQTTSIPRGSKLGSNSIVDTTNKALGSELISSDGKSFYIKTGGLTLEFAWYYQGTNDKFDFDSPLYEDVEIEMKMYDGLFGNDIIKNIYDLFN